MTVINRFIFITLSWLSAGSAIADINTETKLTGLDIAKRIDLADRGWGDVTAELEMTLSNRQGQSSTRSLTIKTLEMAADGDKSLSVFGQPADVAGTAFLSFSHTLEPDQQWLYLPALKRVKRISSVNKSGPFLGSEFSFEDLASFEVEKYSYELLREEVLDGNETYVVRFTPRYEYSGYSSEIVWVDKKRYIILKVDYFDRKGAPLKSLRFNQYQQYLDQYWRASEFLVVNQQTGKSTALQWNNYQFRTGLTDAHFNTNELKRAK